MDEQSLRLPGRVRVYSLVFGTVLAMLIAGLAFPLAFGSRTTATFGGANLDPRQTTFSGSKGVVATGPADAATAAKVAVERPALGSAAARTEPGDPGSGSRPAPTLSPGVKLTATDRGVTANAITVGAILEDAEGTSAIGLDISNPTPDVQKAAYEAFFSDVNARGGILGRKIKAIYRTVNILNTDEITAACREMTEDHKVFAAFTVYGVDGDRELCFTKEHQTPLFRGEASLESNLVASKGYLSTALANSMRLNQNLGWELHRMGVLKGKKIGVLAGSSGGLDTSRADAEAMIKLLRGLGYKIVHVSYLSDAFETAQTQMAGEVSEMKRKGVQVVPMLTNFLNNTTFVQAAESQMFYPQYAVNDWFSNSSDVAAQSMPPSYDGAIAITSEREGEWRTKLPESAADRACLNTYKASTGKTIPHSDDDSRYGIGLICADVYRFVDAASLAGPNLTRVRIAGAVPLLGKRDIPWTGGGSYAAGKLDGADFVRTKRFEFDCTCHVVTEDFRASKF